uniref:Uncharacterized protein n=1 Tax=Candidatus Kentrum sp. UNK TaxID=2126344 RepID=A0A451B059_9GAMM|nr:MAG: hypothetical protein BECKUNK1418G_GA0071005_10334 [Candidatus Kentron sp. UNK]VFK71663.1 MAG: hypothetical protein BECKUNK1418H_GA0071006_107619 [Candidatus Kentron sp. UNK]
MKTKVAKAIIILVAVSHAPRVLAGRPPESLDKWENLCLAKKIEYCQNVGKTAHNNKNNPKLLVGIKLGKITGLIWRERKSIIGYSPAIPRANIPEKIRYAPENAYYYIIDDDWPGDFIRRVDEVDPQ